MKINVRIALVFLLLLPLASCTQSNNTANQPANSAAPSSTGGQKRFAFVTNNASDFWTIARKGNGESGRRTQPM
jgi:ABC-type sugar transport system substrate-binding protein